MNEELDILWRSADAGIRAPHGFEERLFAQLERMPQVAFPAAAPEAMPWWVHLAAERHVAIALALAGLVLVSPAWWLSAAAPARAAIAALGRSAQAGVATWIPPMLATPNAGLALALALTPWLAWGAYRLALTVERRTVRAAFALRR